MVRYVLPYAYLPLGIIRKAKGSIGFWALGNVAFLITAFFMMISRERGTLRETIPESTSVILCLFLLICVGTGTFIAEFSTISNESTRTWEDQLLVALKVGLGAISSITGILFTDPLLHARSFGLTLLFTNFIGLVRTLPMSEAAVLSISNTSIPCIISYLILSKSLRSRFEIFCTQFEDITNYYSCSATFSVFTATILASCCYLTVAETSVQFLIFPSFLAVLLTVYIMRLYYIHRAHKHGQLCEKSLGLAVVVGVSNLYAISSCCSSTEEIIALMPFLLGALLAISFATIFAFVSDVWYGVGTGEFQMITVDTCGILFYFGLPLTILTLRFFEKYGETVDMVNVSLSNIVVSGVDLTIFSDPYIAFASLASFVSFALIIGLPLLNNLCPLSGHVFGRCYTHGQPNTNMIAVCVNFEELCQVSADELESVLKALPKIGFINMFVTVSDLKEHSKKINEIVKKGHLVGLSMNGCGDDVKSLKASYDLFKNTIGIKPEWCHAGEGMSPQCHRLAKDLKMKTALWSTRCNITSKGISNIELEGIKEEISKSCGGSFIYLTAGTEASFSTGLVQVFKTIDEKFIPMQLTVVATDDNSMVLNSK